MSDAADQYDPLAKLLRLQRSLEARGSQGEAVGEQLQEVKNTIHSINDQRSEAVARPRRIHRGPSL